MSTDNHYDFIIIGTGAGGGTLAWKLALRGKRILVIERGGYVPREKDNWNSKAVNAEGNTTRRRHGAMQQHQSGGGRKVTFTSQHGESLGRRSSRPDDGWGWLSCP
jgi:choline dehydrogenase-like flavoprotein